MQAASVGLVEVAFCQFDSAVIEPPVLLVEALVLVFDVRPPPDA